MWEGGQAKEEMRVRGSGSTKALQMHRLEKEMTQEQISLFPKSRGMGGKGLHCMELGAHSEGHL